MIIENNDETKAKDLSAIMVIFGGTGDLTHRKLIPALYNLVHDNLLSENFAIVTIGRKTKTNEEYKNEILVSLKQYSRNKIEDNVLEKLNNILYYYELDFTKVDGYKSLKDYLCNLDEQYKTNGNRLFYLAVAPQYFETIVESLSLNNLAPGEKGSKKLVIEKPFGKDLKTAKKLNESLLKVFGEKEIYRIDHYLGKEMIQNIMVLRFCNPIFESLWSNKYIDNIQITLSEQYGVGSRAGYYENSGALRDMIQNHITQILSLVAMEPPVNLKTESIRSEKLKVIHAIEEFTPESLRDDVVFGQYGKGFIDGQPVQGYRDEDMVLPQSNTETFVALKFHINNFRWAGTPFYVRTGKRLSTQAAQIVIQFKSFPDILYFKDRIQEPNLLVIQIQPKVGVFFQFNTKDFTTLEDIVPTKMETSHVAEMQGNTPEAYERLIFDALRGDATLFTRWDELEASWTIADQIIAHREKSKLIFPNYDSGTMGPVKAFELLARDGKKWWTI
ncbi:glucose-6-phosphate dehydrogenase [[Clostridium] fimetarium]|uniref:Glucose-6-phosphate 1-dehydrogenase n=1 Tax=[Clostridium] fimetarium TaxID=99656 RepID=A0A1I0RJB0_9FIRM|nr:glucose-6-phosphate dehydrogenase [[Clostridium] fimetarium]SEW40985.1 glucose-6-phosphate 1-dehydrogenase [[Clostridium] fimetarium]